MCRRGLYLEAEEEEIIMWDFIGKTSNMIQIVSVIPFLVTAYLFWNRKKKYERLMKEQEGVTTKKPKALAIGLVGTGDISGQVQEFLKANNLKMEIERYFIPAGKSITKDNIHKVLHDLLKIKEKLTSEGTTEVHLFLAAPMVIAINIGALYDNWGSVPVKIYQANRNAGSYEFWTTLSKGYVLGVDDSVMKDLAEAEI